ncbi:late embryogenesis abundant protein D-34 [Cryptomeria japonica]|uniref:late embryogenesis abundant protein D-34 n=1 Tax=Cryptomeria japonica TaxID=3369 RepID=UPI0025AC1030|nr:late embryogenesis abundant protein D-34 [Cryptomeria japonica]XP_057838080.1 late embryogenesis abundant protein D-34 [Cryptomeria japonica]
MNSEQQQEQRQGLGSEQQQEQRQGLKGQTGSEQQQELRPGLEGHTGPITIGEALVVVGKVNSEKQIDPATVSALRSLEGRATGVREGLLGGPASQAQHVLEHRIAGIPDSHTLGQILSRAKDIPELNKPVNMRDAHKVSEAEMRNEATGRMEINGIAATIQRAAEWNAEQGHINPNVN